MPSKPFEPAKSISLSTCPVLPTNALFFSISTWTVEEAKMSGSDTASNIKTVVAECSSEKIPDHGRSDRVTDALGANSNDFSVWELTGWA